MAAPVVEQVVESSTNTAGTSHTVNLPTATAGQLLIIILDKGSTAATINAHASLTELLDENSGNGLYIAYRFMDGSEPASYTLTSSASTRSAVLAYRISGASPTKAPTIGTTGTGTSATPDPPSSGAPPASRDYLFIALAGMAGEEADDDTWGNTSPTNYSPTTPRQKSCGTAGTNLGGLILAAERALTTGSAEDPGTFGVDASAAWRSQTITVFPALSLDAASGSYTVSDSPSATRIVADRSLEGVPGSYALTGLPATLAKGFPFDAQPGSYAVAGVAADLLAGRMVDASPGDYDLTGLAASLEAGRSLEAVPGAYLLTGLATGLDLVRTLDASPGSYALTGLEASLLADRPLEASPGSYAVAGELASLLGDRVLSAVPGVYVIVGLDADLTVTTVGAYALNAQPGSYSLSGFTAGLEAGRSIGADPGSYLLAGVDIGFLRELLLAASPGSYAVVGLDADLRHVGTEVIEFPIGRAPVIGNGAVGNLASAGVGRILEPDDPRLEVP